MLHSVRLSHVVGIHPGALGDASMQGWSQFCCMFRSGGSTWGHSGALDKRSSKQGCIQAPSLCLEKRTSEPRDVCPNISQDSGKLGAQKWGP